MNPTKLKHILFDWGNTLMSEDGPQDYTMADWPEVRAINGAVETLRELSKHYRLAIATNATLSKRADIERALQRVDLAPFISEIFCYTEIGYRKDEPTFWSHVLTKLKATPDEVLMIGDSLKQDVLGPRQAGIKAIWFNWKGSDEIGSDTIITITSLDELPAILFKFIRSIS